MLIDERAKAVLVETAHLACDQLYAGDIDGGVLTTRCA